MRTTISLSDELYEDLKVYAKANGITLTRAASVLMERGLRPRHFSFTMVNGFPVIDPQPGDKKITTEDVIRILNEDV